MKTNIYTLFTALLFSFLLQVQAQDSSACNPGFSAWSSGGLVTFRAYDSLPGIRHGWSFGDGGGFSPMAGGVNVQHQYAASGTYTVYHFIMDTSGSNCHDTAVQPVTVELPSACPISIGQLHDSLPSPGRYRFYAIPGGDTVRWYINNAYIKMGDTLTGYFIPGTYTICAYRHMPDSCVNSACISLYVADTTRADTTRTDSTVTDTTHLPPPPPPADSLGRNDQIPTYPNPAPGESNIDLQLDGNSTIQIQVFNSMGHLMLSRKVAGVSGLNHITLPVAGLPKGIYYVQVEYGNVKKRSRIQKL